MITPDIIELLAKASGEAYEIKQHHRVVPDLDMDVIKVLVEPTGAVRGFVGSCYAGKVVAIKGTASVKDLLVDVEFFKRALRGTMVHEGFLFEHDRVLKHLPIGELIGTDPIYVTGHSLGGAVASLLALSLKSDYPELDIRPVTFGCPYVGDRLFAKNFDKLFPKGIRMVHDFDIVPRLNALGSVHVGGLLHLDRTGKKVGIARGVLGQIAHWVQLVRKDIRGECLRDHHEANYIMASSAYRERREMREKKLAQ